MLPDQPPPTFDLLGHAERIEADGYTIIPDFLSGADQAEVRRVLALYLGTHTGRNEFEGTRTERVYTLVARARVFWRIVLDVRILALCGRFLQPGFLLTASQAILINPGETPQPFHSDDVFYTVPRPRPMISLSTIVAVGQRSPSRTAVPSDPREPPLGRSTGPGTYAHIGAYSGEPAPGDLGLEPLERSPIYARRRVHRVRRDPAASWRQEPQRSRAARVLEPVLRALGAAARELHPRRPRRGGTRDAGASPGDAGRIRSTLLSWVNSAPAIP